MTNTLPTNDSYSSQFEHLVARARYGDEKAVAKLLAEFSAVITRELRTQRRFSSLQSFVDADDLAQSVWRCFFGALIHGDASFNDAKAVATYLTKVTQNRIESQFRKQRAVKRDIRRTVSSTNLDIADKNLSQPAQALSAKELLQAVFRQMTPEERHISKRRAEGATWDDLANELNTTAEALRKRHTRAAARILGELEADDGKA